MGMKRPVCNIKILVVTNIDMCAENYIYYNCQQLNNGTKRIISSFERKFEIYYVLLRPCAQ